MDQNGVGCCAVSTAASMTERREGAVTALGADLSGEVAADGGEAAAGDKESAS